MSRNIIIKGARYLLDPNYRFVANGDMGFYKSMDDTTYITKRFRAVMGYTPDLKNPITFNEKIQWLKLHDRKDAYTQMVDKYEAKEYVASILGEQYIIPTYGVWEKFEDIDFSVLPSQFVLKCTHDSGGLVVVRDKDQLDCEVAKRKIETSLKRNYYYLSREWPYKNVQPRIIAEKYMEEGPNGLRDYKFFNFNGKAEFIYISENLEHHDKATISFLDLDGNRLPFRRMDYRDFEGKVDLPANYKEMMEVSGILAKAIDSPFVRTDFYSIQNNIYFSEITFSPCGGMLPFSPPEWDKKIGELLILPIDEDE